MQTMKELIETGFFPSDPETDFPLVPIVGDGDDYQGAATIFVTDAPGEWCIVGVGPKGYAAQWNEFGVRRPDTALVDDEPVHMDDDSLLAQSLAMPRVETFKQYMTIEADGTVIDVFATRDEAMDSFIPEGGQMVEVDGQRYVSEPLEQPSGFLFDSAYEPGPEVKADAPFGGFYRGLLIFP
jgi:hypothetical protein